VSIKKEEREERFERENLETSISGRNISFEEWWSESKMIKGLYGEWPILNYEISL